jgi:hypothetical protein
MLQLAFAGRQSSHNLSQRPRAAQMAKQERDELAPTGHPFGVLFGLVLAHRTFKYSAWNETQNLTENAAYSFHGRVILSGLVVSQLQLYSDCLLIFLPSALPTGPSCFSNVLDSSATRPGESGIKEVCERLLPRLDQEAGFSKWERCDCDEGTKPNKDEKDCLVHATDGSFPLRMQVVRPGGVWKPKQKDLLPADYELSVDEVAGYMSRAE